MARAVLFEWEGREYEHNPRGADWYWVVGIIAAAAAVAAALFGNYLLALLVIVGAASIALHAMKHPPLHHFRLYENGLTIGSDFHPFEKMLSFSLLEDPEGELPPQLSVKTKGWISPHLVIPLEEADADAVYAIFLEHVEEEEHHHSLSDLVAAWLGF